MGNETSSSMATTTTSFGGPDASVVINCCWRTVLEYCDDRGRDDCALLSKRFRDLCRSESYFRLRCERLHEERGIYHPPVLDDDDDNDNNHTWRSLFVENFQRRELWIKDDDDRSRKRRRRRTRDDDDDDDDREFKVSVCVRFRPRRSDDERGGERKDDDKVPLPLHQRLALIRYANGLSSNREALRVLRKQGHWFSWTTTDAASANTDAARSRSDVVVVHKRHAAATVGVGVHDVRPEDDTVVIVEPNKGLGGLRFDRVLDEYCGQEDCYRRTGVRDKVSRLLRGTNVTVLAYGRTGAGKTHTVVGGGDDDDAFVDGRASRPCAHWGLSPRTTFDVCRALDRRRRAIPWLDAELTVHHVEIFGDKVRDLTNGGVLVSTHEGGGSGSGRLIRSFSEMADLLNEGERLKRRAATRNNERSSRAHSLLMLTLRQRTVPRGDNDEAAKTITSHMFIADLGGSEQLKDENIDTDTDTVAHRQRRDEAVKINMGLLALKQCVDHLRRRCAYVPFADSRLTSLLAPGLSRGRTTVIVCASRDPRHGAETLGALRFGRVCGRVRTTTDDERGDDRGGAARLLLRRLDADVAAAEEAVRAKERWRTTREEVVDDHGEVEVRQTTVLVGAEEERGRLEDLLRRRAELVGDGDDDPRTSDP